MPIWVQPSLRLRQAAEEAEGLIQVRNSVSMTILLAAEAAGLVVKPPQPGKTVILRGNVYTSANTK